MFYIRIALPLGGTMPEYSTDGKLILGIIFALKRRYDQDEIAQYSKKKNQKQKFSNSLKVETSQVWSN